MRAVSISWAFKYFMQWHWGKPSRYGKTWRAASCSAFAQGFLLRSASYAGQDGGQARFDLVIAAFSPDASGFSFNHGNHCNSVFFARFG